jgi:DNA replication factor GINS
MNLEELRSVQRAERQKDSLQHLRDSFYEDVADYVVQLKDERERAVEAADDPFASEDVRQLTDEIESTQEIANALYERRVGKVVKHASFAAADMATDEEGMTAEERELFEDLVARIRENRETVMATLDGKRGRTETSTDAAVDDSSTDPVSDASASADDHASTAPEPASSSTADPADDLLADALGDSGGTDAPAAPPDTAEAPAVDASTTAQTPGSTPADTTGSETDRPADEAAVVSSDGTTTSAAPATSPADAGRDGAADTNDGDARERGPERTTLRITADVGTVYGVDEREYDLARDDVVMLPTTNAEPLLQKDAAERID